MPVLARFPTAVPETTTTAAMGMQPSLDTEPTASSSSSSSSTTSSSPPITTKAENRRLLGPRKLVRLQHETPSSLTKPNIFALRRTGTTESRLWSSIWGSPANRYRNPETDSSASSSSSVPFNGATPLAFILLLLFATVFLTALLAFLVLRSQPVCTVHPHQSSSPASSINATAHSASSFDFDLPSSSDMDEMSAFIASTVDGRRHRDHVSKLAARAHPAGTRRNELVAHYVHQQYSALGLRVRRHNYSVLLNYPDWESPNTVDVLERTSVWRRISHGRGGGGGRSAIGGGGAASSSSEFGDPYSLHWWTAYSTPGVVTAPVVYANYATLDDFAQLDKWNVSVRDRIVLCRYGVNGRVEKVWLAETRKAKAVVIYSDPAEFLKDEPSRVFPEDVWLPGTAAQRGTLLRTEGDPETPRTPSKPWAFRGFSEEAAHRQQSVLPQIPVTPIGYDDARLMMGELDGQEVPSPHWRGALNVTYRLSGSAVFRVSVRSTNQRRPISNVCAEIRGSHEPNRVLLMTNHYDAWTSGALDPASGTAVLLETARVLSLLNGKWAFRRSVMMCHFDAEEFGLIGSTEFVDQFLHSIRRRVLSVLNVDHLAGNSTVAVRAVPLLYQAIAAAAGRVPSPSRDERDNGRETLLDSWRFHGGRGPLADIKGVPAVSPPTTGSDYHRFISLAGVPVADLRLEGSQYTFMVYHSEHDTTWASEHIYFRDHLAPQSAAHLLSELAHRLLNERVLPLDATAYGSQLWDATARLETRLTHLVATIPGVTSLAEPLRYLRTAVRRFQSNARSVQTAVEQAERRLTRAEVDDINERLCTLESAFVTEGPPTTTGWLSPWVQRHVVFGQLPLGTPNPLMAGSPQSLPLSVVALPLSQLLHATDDDHHARVSHIHTRSRLADNALQHKQLRNLRAALATLTQCVETAADWLELDNLI